VRAAALKELGGPSVYEDTEEPVPGDGQVVVGMMAAAVDHVDWRSGHFYLGPPALPSTPGMDGVGHLPDSSSRATSRSVGSVGSIASATRSSPRRGRPPGPLTCYAGEDEPCTG
jgi:NADPH:quinone reductase-like Zn-dependent oxidoreductase